MLAEIVNGRILCETEYRDRELIKSVPGSRWDANSSKWYVPLSWSSCKALRGVFRDRLDLGPDLITWAQMQRDLWIDEAMVLRTALEAEGDQRLYPFQRADVKFLKLVERALLGNDMGTGKTVSSATALQELAESGQEIFPLLIICPNSMKRTWEKEIRKWLPAAEPIIIGSVWNEKKGKFVNAGAVQKKRQFVEAVRIPNAAIIINFEAMRLHSRLAPYGSIALTPEDKRPKELNLFAFRAVIIDEAHRIIHPDTKQTRACWAAAGDARFRWALTGTPSADGAPDDLWGILHFVDPGEWPAKSKYIDRYCLTSWNAFGGMDVIGVRPDTRDEFFSILDPHFRRMTKDVVLPFLPKKTRETRYAEMSPKQAKAYEEMHKSQLVETEDGGAIIATNQLTKNTRLIQFSSSFAGLNDENEVRLMEPSNKLDAFMDFLGDMSREASVVVAAESRQLIMLLAKRLEVAAEKHKRDPWLHSFRMIVGGMSTDEREAHKDDFQAQRARIMLMTIKAGGVGITLTRADTLCFLQRSWSMIDNKQAEDRVHRIGSEIHDKITIVDFVAPGTVEEGQIAAVHEKLRRLEEITRDVELIRARIAELELQFQTEELGKEIARLQVLELEKQYIETVPLWEQPVDLGAEAMRDALALLAG